MSNRDDRVEGFRALPGRGLIGTGMAVGLIWLGWQIVLVPMSTRAPSEYAVRLNPGSAMVLASAAEAEWRAGRMENADALARLALYRAPFTLPALRVVGLVEGETGDRVLADDILTLAGNWSLRDDSSHGWLIENRLRRGDYGSAFAHADTLARRRTSLHPQIFELFATAIETDPRAFAFLAGELVDSPPWRPAFISSLYRRDGGVGLVAQLALLMKDSEGRFSDAELQRLYQALYTAGQIEALRQVRSEIGRPSEDGYLIDGAFQAPEAILPFGWSLGVGAGYSVAALADGGPAEGGPEGEPTGALRVAHNGQSLDVLAQQVTLLDPGRYRLKGRWRWEFGQTEMRFAWQVVCGRADDVRSEVVFRAPASTTTSGGDAWMPFSSDFQISGTDCGSQTLRLVGQNPGRRTNVTLWFSQLEIVAVP